VTDIPLRRRDLAPDPGAQFARWYAEATEAEGYPRVDAIALATSTPDGTPAARLVLFKGFDGAGLVFHTNYESRKGRELQANPLAAVAFYWPELHRQVRAAGPVTRLSSEESDAYFATRPREARLAALSSHQSEVVESREALEARYRELEARYSGEDVPRPSFWGGLRLAPEEWEFWQGRENRLHDRFRYRRESGGDWIVERLAP
jgi:pyridoxamine 5'-phosphate oxidase